MFILLTYLYIWILTLRTKVLNKFCSMRFRIRESSRLWGILLRSHFKGLWNYLIRRKLPLIFLAFFFNKNVPLNVATKYFKKAPKLVWTCSSWIRLKGITFFAVMKRCMQIGFNFHKKIISLLGLAAFQDQILLWKKFHLIFLYFHSPSR